MVSAIPVLAFAPRVMSNGRPRPSRRVLAAAVVTRDGPRAGTHALTGLVRSLPCYLTFGLVVILAAPSIGLAAIAVGLPACLAAARATWRGVPVVRQPAFDIT